jgi:uncharacterized membrane protein YGL010W
MKGYYHAAYHHIIQKSYMYYTIHHMHRRVNRTHIIISIGTIYTGACVTHRKKIRILRSFTRLSPKLLYNNAFHLRKKLQRQCFLHAMMI